MSSISYDEFKTELRQYAVAIDETSQNLSAANKEYERTKADFFEKQDTATPQERYDLGQQMHAAGEEADGCKVAQASALEAFGQLVQAHPEYANRAAEEMTQGSAPQTVGSDAPAPGPEANPLKEAMSSAWQSLGEGASKIGDALTGNVAKHVIAAGIALIAALEEPAVMNHENRESLEAPRAGVERVVTAEGGMQQAPPAAAQAPAQAQTQSDSAAPAHHEQEAASQHHKGPEHEHLIWPKLQPDVNEDEESSGVVNEPPVNDNTDWHREAANDNNPHPPEEPQAARAQAVNEGPQASDHPAVHLHVVPPPPPPPPAPAAPEADQTRSR